ncbi:PREDICTED: clathrin light chain A [Pygoscelis adeliae]|uniref:clathrin light chain A n=1 Tax=Pygoscelis adeliae TaxID=9238 RepID=UPI0004F4F550|nr:PREDICTED: clathrin light chain A [Pygoscelis adeliae]
MARRCVGTGIRCGSLPCLHRIHEEGLPCGRKPAQLHLTGRSDRNATGRSGTLASGAVDGVVNGDVYQETNGPTDSYAAISQVDRLQSEPESIRKWREEQKERLEQLDANSRKQEAEWKEKAIKELEEWYARQDEKLQKTKASNRVADEAFYKQPFADVIGYVAAEEAFVNDAEDIFPGTEWERVAQLCDFNPKSSKQAKDVSRMRSVLISLKQAPLVR